MKVQRPSGPRGRVTSEILNVMSTRPLLALVCLAAWPGAYAQTPDQAEGLKKLQAEIEENRQKMFVPGASLAVIKDDKVILLRGFGYRDLKTKAPVTPDTLFAIGSTSKAFTSMLMAMAVDEGKVKFTDRPGQYLPYFRMSDPETDKAMTISDMLSHRSGLPRTDLILFAGDLSAEEMIWNVTRATPTAKLGAKWQYQNVMFVAAGEILRTVFGQPWGDLVRQRITEPLGMKRTNTSVPQTLQDPDHSHGYDGSPAMKELPMRDIASAAPAGAINSSARDMAEWIRFLLRKGEIGGKKLVSEESYAELFKPRITVGGPLKYGYGWFIDDWNGHAVYQHGGNIDGFNAQVAMMPDQSLGMVLLTNVSAGPLTDYSMKQVWKDLVGEPVAKITGVELKNPDQEVGTYRLEVAKLDFVVTHEGNKLFVKPTGQPKMEMIPLGDRKYTLAPPAPEKVFMTFSPDKENPKLAECLFEQDGQKFVMKQPKPYEAPISVDELMAKAIQAAGGAENLSKVRTLSYRYWYDMETQGVRAAGTVAKVAPNMQGDLSVFTAGGHRIGWDHTAYDGTRAVEEASFAPRDEKSGDELGNLAVDAAMSQELQWRTLFTKVAIVGEEKIEGEDAYKVEKTPKVGNKVTDWISKSSFRLLKRVTGSGGATLTDVYKEYKEVNGVQIPTSIIRTTPIGGKGTVTVWDIRVNEPVDPTLVKTK